MSFANKVVIITGASSGIGHALARQLAAQQARVGLVARRQDLLNQLAEAIRQSGGTAVTAVADVGDRAQVTAAIGQLRQQLGPVDLLLANAGYGVPTYLDQSNIEQVEQMVRVNYLGVIYSISAVLPEMLERGQGHLAAVSSLAGFKGLPGESGYCSTKAAVITYMEGLRIQLRTKGVAVTTICPGFVDTPMIHDQDFPKPMQMTAEEAARRIMAALRRRVGFFAFPWPIALLMRLTRWAPDWLVLKTLAGKIRRESKKTTPAEQKVVT